MNRFYIFLLRAILSLVFAVILSRIFFSNTNPVYVAGFAILLIMAAYFSEYLRQKKQR